jgi:hypothetical protein
MGADGWAVIVAVCRTGGGPLVNFAHFSKFDDKIPKPTILASVIARNDLWPGGLAQWTSQPPCEVSRVTASARPPR